MTLDGLLSDLGACREAREWASQFPTLRKAWQACKRGDWMLWLTARMAGKPGWPPRRKVVLAMCACVARALPMCRQEERLVARHAIAVTRRWARGKATVAAVRAVVRAVGAAANVGAARTSYYAAAANVGAARAAYCATYYAANDHAAYPAYAAYSAASAARLDAARASGDFRAVFRAANAARDASLATSADICRRMLKIPEGL